MALYLYTLDSRPRLDVSHLPTSSMDSHTPAWWGNVLLMCIETTTILLLLGTYLYLRQNFESWPPPRVDVHPPMKHPFPSLPTATVDLALVTLGCIPMYLTNLAARRHDHRATCAGLFFMLTLTLILIALRFHEFKGLYFRWDDNAYASIMWWILATHLTYLATAAGEFLVMAAWLLTHDIDTKHALDVTLAGGFFYWVASTYVLIYATTYLGPRLF